MYPYKQSYRNPDDEEWCLKALPPGKRNLTVYAKYLEHEHYYPYILPEIRLCGQWLKRTGFKVGQKITVEHRREKLIITIKKEVKGET